MAEDSESDNQPVIQPLVCLNRKPYPNRTIKPSCQDDGDIERLCKLLTEDIRKREATVTVKECGTVE
jgi:hypothetical protein